MITCLSDKMEYVIYIHTFHYSVWLLMVDGTNGGVLVAKTSDSGSTIFYSLEVVANGVDFLIRFSYLPSSRIVHISKTLLHKCLKFLHNIPIFTVWI